MAESALQQVALELRMHDMGVGDARALAAALRAFEAALRAAPPAERAALMDTQLHPLLRVRRELEEAAAGRQTHALVPRPPPGTVGAAPARAPGRADAQLRGFFDRIFHPERGLLPVSHRQPSGVTVRFGELIRGITHFADQGDGRGAVPVYHRLFSCGPGDQAYRDGRLVCHEELTTAERNRRRPEIERCYIERLVYDALYRKEALSQTLAATTATPYGDAAGGTVARANAAQDPGHLFRIDLTRRDFETCFPDHRVEVDVGFHDGWPTVVTVARMVRGRLVTTDVFRKALLVPGPDGRVGYDEVVECERTVAATGAVLRKAQGFASGEAPWRRAVAGRRAAAATRASASAAAAARAAANASVAQTAAAEARARTYRPWRTSWNAATVRATRGVAPTTTHTPASSSTRPRSA